MNLVRNSNKLFLSLEKTDLDKGTYKIWTELEYVLDQEKLENVTVRVYDDSVLSMQNLSVLASLGLKLQQNTLPANLESTPKIIGLIRDLNFSGYFAKLIDAH